MVIGWQRRGGVVSEVRAPLDKKFPFSTSSQAELITGRWPGGHWHCNKGDRRGGVDLCYLFLNRSPFRSWILTSGQKIRLHTRWARRESKEKPNPFPGFLLPLLPLSCPPHPTPPTQRRREWDSKREQTAIWVAGSDHTVLLIGVNGSKPKYNFLSYIIYPSIFDSIACKIEK